MVQTIEPKAEPPAACPIDSEVDSIIRNADAASRGHYLVSIRGGAPQWLTAYEIEVTLSYLDCH